MSIPIQFPHIVVAYAISICKEDASVRRYLDEYKQLCKNCKIKDILYPDATCHDDYHQVIDDALVMLNVALEYYFTLMKSL